MQPTKHFNRYQFLKEPMIRTPAQHQTDPAKKPGQVGGREFHDWYQANKHKFGYDYEKAKEAFEAPKTLQAPIARTLLEPQSKTSAPIPLAAYIQRVQEAEKALPEPTVVVSKPVIERVVKALWWSNPYLAGVLQKELDKAQQ